VQAGINEEFAANALNQLRLKRKHIAARQEKKLLVFTEGHPPPAAQRTSKSHDKQTKRRRRGRAPTTSHQPSTSAIFDDTALATPASASQSQPVELANTTIMVDGTPTVELITAPFISDSTSTTGMVMTDPNFMADITPTMEFID
jgi:hypothetical protein